MPKSAGDRRQGRRQAASPQAEDKDRLRQVRGVRCRAAEAEPAAADLECVAVGAQRGGEVARAAVGVALEHEHRGRRGVVRAIGDPHQRFEEDALRLLRGIRFAANLNFTLDAHTSEAITAKARYIQNVSRERVRDEMAKMLTGPRPARAIELLSDHKLLSWVIPELEETKGVRQLPEYQPGGDVWRHTLEILKALPPPPSGGRPEVLAWAALLLPAELGARTLLRMKFRRFLNEVILLPAQILRRGRRLIFRLLAINRWVPLLLDGTRALKRLCLA